MCNNTTDNDELLLVAKEISGSLKQIVKLLSKDEEGITLETMTVTEKDVLDVDAINTNRMIHIISDSNVRRLDPDDNIFDHVKIGDYVLLYNTELGYVKFDVVEKNQIDKEVYLVTSSIVEYIPKFGTAMLDTDYVYSSVKRRIDFIGNEFVLKNRFIIKGIVCNTYYDSMAFADTVIQNIAMARCWALNMNEITMFTKNGWDWQKTYKNYGKEPKPADKQHIKYATRDVLKNRKTGKIDYITCGESGKENDDKLGILFGVIMK